MFLPDDSNPRVMIVARVAIGVTREIDEDKHRISMERVAKLPYFNADMQPIDTFCNEDKTVFIKTHINEVYPEQVLIYRDKTGVYRFHN